MKRLALSMGAVAALTLGVAAQEPLHAHRGSSPLIPDATAIVTLTGVPDPHGSPSACAECHGPGQPDQAPGMGACRRCHPGADLHLVDVAPLKIKVPVDMLQAGRLACASCHDEPACDGLPKEGRGADHFRGGPYAATLDLCYRCHPRATFQRTDPHRELLTPDGRRNHALCVFCHQGVPESSDDPLLHGLRPVELCKGCHAHQIHIGIPSHLVIAPEKQRGRIEAWNATHTFPIRLGARGEITCTTCHDPHPGMEPAEGASSPRALDRMRLANRNYRDQYFLPRIEGEIADIHDAEGRALRLADGPRLRGGMLRVPAEDGELCMVCHVPGEK